MTYLYAPVSSYSAGFGVHLLSSIGAPNQMAKRPTVQRSPVISSILQNVAGFGLHHVLAWWAKMGSDDAADQNGNQQQKKRGVAPGSHIASHGRLNDVSTCLAGLSKD
jgi:hypothetical protein